MNFALLLNAGQINHIKMATSIFFTESKDFKLIKDRILNQEDNYLVYVYADTTNVRIPRELIMQLPRYGNNLIWVDTADMDSSDMSHHIVLTIGQLVNPEEEIDFYIVSKSSKLEKTIFFLRNQGIPAEMIAPAEARPKAEKTKGTGKRGRPKKVQSEVKPAKATGKRGRPRKVQPEAAVEAVIVEDGLAPVKSGKRGRPKKVQAEAVPAIAIEEAPKKKRGRPSRPVAQVEETVLAEPKKRGRKKIEKPVVEEKPKRGRKPKNTILEVSEESSIKEEKIEKSEKKEKKAKKEKRSKKAKEVSGVIDVKPRKQRVDKEITEQSVQDKLDLYATTDTNLSMVMTRLFNLKKVARPKFEAKLIDLVKDITLEDDTIAEQIVTQLQEMNVLESTGPGGRVFYKD